MKLNQFDIWLADPDPSRGTEPGKTRPVVITQTDLLNAEHPSVIICPITSKVVPGIEFLRVRLGLGVLNKPSDILVDQLRAIDRRRLIKRLGKLRKDQKEQLIKNLKVVLDLG